MTLLRTTTHLRSLSSAIEDELAEVARALGLAGADALRSRLMRSVQAHFEGGGGAQLLIEAASAAAPLVRAYARLVGWCRAAAAAACAGLARCLAPLAKRLCMALSFLVNMVYSQEID